MSDPTRPVGAVVRAPNAAIGGGPPPAGTILRRTFGPQTTRLRVLTAEEERRRARPRYRSRLAIALDLDRRLAALGYEAP
jgi:hypothetical protein